MSSIIRQVTQIAAFLAMLIEYLRMQLTGCHHVFVIAGTIVQWTLHDSM